MIERLFVYGTLGPGRPNAHILENIGGSFEDAFLQGVLHEKGWGAEMGFPGIVLDKDADAISGFMFSSPNLKEHWKSLDAFEGDAYERVYTDVKLWNNTHVKAFVYVIKI